MDGLFGEDDEPLKSSSNHGQGATTKEKERAIEYSMSISAFIHDRWARCHPPLGRFPFHVYDANCGPGYNLEAAVPGTPVIARRVFAPLLETWQSVKYTFCDMDRVSLNKLRERLGPANPREVFYFVNCDNNDGLKQFAATIYDRSRFAKGVVIVDPNGCVYRNAKGKGPPTELPKFLTRFPCIDLIQNINIQAHIRQWNTNFPRFLRKDGTPWKDCRPPFSIEGYMRSIPKKFWLLREHKDRHHTFLLLIGSNFEYGKSRKFGFVAHDSDEGEVILSKIRSKERIE